MSSINQIFFCILTIVSLAAHASAQSADIQQEAQRLARVAQTAEQQGRNDEAIKAYETIAVIAKSYPKIAADALLHSGGIYMQTGRFDKASEAFRRAVALNPQSPEAHNNFGEALGEEKKYQAALAEFQQAVNLDGHYVKARYNMGVTYERLGQMKYAEFV